jgi:hypothetical protein
MAWGLTRSGMSHNRAFLRQHPVYLGHRWHPPPHQAHDNGHHAAQGQEPLPHADEPQRLPRIAPLHLAWGEQGRLEQVRQALCNIFHRWHLDLLAVPKLSMGTGSRVFVCHGGAPLVRGPIIAQTMI